MDPLITTRSHLRSVCTARFFARRCPLLAPCGAEERMGAMPGPQQVMQTEYFGKE